MVKIFTCLSFIISLTLAANGQVTVSTDTLTAYSPSLKRNFKAVVYSPANVDGQSKFPVVYLLHGYSGSYRDWPGKMAGLGAYAALYKFIIVCPDGGYGSWYINSTVDPSSQMESFIAKDLPLIIDQKYPTIRSKNKRAITGLSMGGHGALMIAMKYPEIFGSCSSISGTLDLDQIDGKYESHKILGDRSANSKTWTSNSVLILSRSINDSVLNIYIDCGTEDYFMKSNRAVHEELMKRKITHAYTERTGNHNWEYWTSSLPFHLLFFDQYFRRNK